jgi:hypothetical protein
MRNDSVLYSGASSNRNVLEQRQKRERERQETRSQLLPIAELLTALVANEQAELGNKLLAIINPETPDDQVPAKLQAIRMHKEFLEKFDAVLRKYLRVTPSEVKAEQKERSDAS